MATTATTPSTTNPSTTTPSTSDLPARLRVHALAKLLGVTSKQVLAELTSRGLEVRSAQSSVDRDVAEQVRDALAPTADAPPTPGASPAAPTPEASLPTAQVDSGPAPLPDLAEPDTDSGDPAAVPLFLPPEPVKAPPRRRRATRATAAPTADEPTADPVVADEARSDTAEPVAAQAETAPTTSDQAPGDDGDGDGDDSGPRRRRRGRRGRGRGRGPQDGDGETGSDDPAGGSEDTPATAGTEGATATDTTDTSDTSDTGDAAGSEASDGSAGADAAAAGPGGGADDAGSGDDSDGDDESGSGSRRRRRRRRRRGGEDGGSADGSGSGSGSGSGDDDKDADTVVHEREPRSKSRRSRGGSGGSSSSDEVQGITGSTRLEAKRQRRKDGRDQGRRRPPILSEAEFLARREAVARTMVVRERDGHGEDSLTQVAVLEDGVLVEHFVTSSGTPSMVGNIYLGRVQNVLPSMEAAFIDIGRGRNGVLYAGEVDWDAAGLGGRSRKIEQALSSGDLVLVQVSKDPVGHKGARLTTQISLPGRFLVYVPGGTSAGISRKLPDTERSRLKAILKKIVPEDAGVIIRTASEGVAEEELARDVDRLQAQWESVAAEAERVTASGQKSPHSLYEEPDLLVKVVRDLFNSDVEKIVVSGDGAWDTVSRYVHEVSPDLEERLERHEGTRDVFAELRVDEQLTKALERKVMLPSGGSLVIDRTEAMTVVDVNTGKYTGSGGNLEETVTRNNLEAAEEVVRQMRLRDIGGMIVVDFIDMVLEGNRELVLRRLTECLGRDRTRHQVSEVTSLGLVQMTRKKLGQGLVESFSTPCEHCHGRGVVVQAEPVQAPAGSGGSSGGGGGGGGGTGDGGGKRSRRGGRGEQTPETPPARVVPKGPHPAFLAAAKASAGAAAGDEVAADEPALTQSEVATTGSAPQPDPAATPDEVRGTAGEQPVDPAGEQPVDPAGEQPADATGEQPAEPPARPARARRPRRASRPTAAPDTVTAVPDVTVPDAAEPGHDAEPAAPAVAGRPDEPEREAASTPEVELAEAADSSVPAAADETPGTPPAPAVARPRRRRAAGRPAGPPVGAEA